MDQASASPETVVAELTTIPITLDEARVRLPNEPGFYAWWTRRGSIPTVPECPHPSVAGWLLLYVGISPSSATSKRTLRERVRSNHMGGNTGSSTFRLTLASLLIESMGWEPVMRDRPLLTKEDNNALSAWQRENLRLTWTVRERPWEIEKEVIRQLQPPLNIAGNKSHPFSASVSAARKRFHEAARISPV